METSLTNQIKLDPQCNAYNVSSSDFTELKMPVNDFSTKEVEVESSRSYDHFSEGGGSQERSMVQLWQPISSYVALQTVKKHIYE